MARRRAFAPNVETAISGAAQRYGLSVDVLRAIARVESGGNPGAQTGSYRGLFQLGTSNFSRFGSGNILDPADNANAAAAQMRHQMVGFEKRYGRPPTAAEVYMQHQQGVGGAAMHWANPDRPAWQNMAATGEGRQRGERWARQAVWGNVPADLRRQFGSVDNITSRQFTAMWSDVLARRGGLDTASTSVATVAPMLDAPTTLAGGPASAVAMGEDPSQGVAAFAQPALAGALAPPAHEVAGKMGGEASATAMGEMPPAPTMMASPASPPPAPAPEQGTLGAMLGLGGGGGGIFGGAGIGGAGGGRNPLAAVQAALSRPQPTTPLADPLAVQASLDRADAQEQSLERTIFRLPPAPPRTPPSMPVFDFTGRRQRRSSAA